MKPPFLILAANYPRFDQRETLYHQIGWSDVIDHPAFQDTCAIRMSLALVASGFPLTGNMKVNAGRLKGRAIETAQARLSNTLKRAWGKPEVYRGELEARPAVANRSGVVSFFQIRGPAVRSGGHIDLVFPGAAGLSTCARSCFFGAAEVWFWPLKCKLSLAAPYFGKACTVFTWRAAHSGYWCSSLLIQACQTS